MTHCATCNVDLTGPKADRIAACRNPACFAAEPTVQDALSELLTALGFAAMARDALGEHEPDRLSRYARIILKQSAPQHQLALRERFHALHLL